MVLEENVQTTEATKAPKEIKMKGKQGYLDDMKKAWRDCTWNISPKNRQW